QGPEQDASPRAPSDPGGTHEPAVLPGGGWRPSLRVPWLLAKCVDTRPAPCARSATPRWRAQILACPASCGNCAHHALADNVRPAYCRQVEYCPTSIQQARAQRARNIRHFFAQPDDLLFGCRHVGDHVAYLRTGAQELAVDVDRGFGEQLVDARKHARIVAMDVKQESASDVAMQ